MRSEHGGYLQSVRRVASRALGVAIDKKLAAYRPMATRPSTAWDSAYASGKLDYYSELEQNARYSVLRGYLAFFGGSPKILDVGCGVGLMRAHLAGLEFSRYVGIDVSAAAIEKAQRLRDEQTEFVVGELPPPAGGLFDTVILNEVLYYPRDPEEFLDRVAILLEEDGHLLTSIWHHRGDSALHRMLDARFRLVDALEVRNLTRDHPGWRLACHRRS